MVRLSSAGPGYAAMYLHARYYDPQLGIFLSPDRLHPTTPGVGLNRYAYSGGNPVNATDRSGMRYTPQQTCGPVGDQGGGDCGGGGGGGDPYFVPGGGIGFLPGGNPALNELAQLETRMQNTPSTYSINFEQRGDGNREGVYEIDDLPFAEGLPLFAHVDESGTVTAISIRVTGPLSTDLSLEGIQLLLGPSTSIGAQPGPNGVTFFVDPAVEIAIGGPNPQLSRVEVTYEGEFVGSDITFANHPLVPGMAAAVMDPIAEARVADLVTDYRTPFALAATTSAAAVRLIDVTEAWLP